MNSPADITPEDKAALLAWMDTITKQNITFEQRITELTRRHDELVRELQMLLTQVANQQRATAGQKPQDPEILERAKRIAALRAQKIGLQQPGASP